MQSQEKEDQLRRTTLIGPLYQGFLMESDCNLQNEGEAPLSFFLYIGTLSYLLCRELQHDPFRLNRAMLLLHAQPADLSANMEENIYRRFIQVTSGCSQSSNPHQ